MAEVKVDLDLSSGKISVVCPEESLTRVFEAVESFLPKLTTSRESMKAEAGDGSSAAGSEKTENYEPRGKRGGSSSKPTYSTVELGLGKDQEREFKKYYDGKNPQNQNDQTLVVMYWLQQNAKKDIFDPNEIFTGFRKVGAKVPARIESVLSNLILEGKVVSAGGGKYKLNHIGEDRVDKELPASKAA